MLPWDEYLLQKEILQDERSLAKMMLEQEQSLKD